MVLASHVRVSSFTSCKRPKVSSRAKSPLVLLSMLPQCCHLVNAFQQSCLRCFFVFFMTKDDLNDILRPFNCSGIWSWATSTWLTSWPENNWWRSFIKAVCGEDVAYLRHRRRESAVCNLILKPSRTQIEWWGCGRGGVRFLCVISSHNSLKQRARLIYSGPRKKSS